MKVQEILSRVDHTLLSPTATAADILAVCDDGMRFHTATVCIPAAFVAAAKAHVGDNLKICTVIGFPNGYSTTAAKCFEAADAIRNGADEIDMVIHLGLVKAGRFDAVLEEIRAVKAACGQHPLKVIIETCLLTDAEKIRLCEVVSQSGAEYIKTSTGFSTGGATAADVALLRAHSAPHLRVKAAGGIATLADAARFIRLGADRLGTSRIVKLLKNGDESTAYQEY